MKETTAQQLINQINDLLETERDDKTFLDSFKQLLPQLDSHLRVRTPRIFDRISDEFYDEFRTPAAEIHLKALRSILFNSEIDSATARKQIIKLFEKRTVAETNSGEIKVDQESKDNTELTEYQAAVWEMIKNINDFFCFQASEFNDWEQIINGNLFNHDHIELLSAKIPRKIIKDFAALIQDFYEIDPNIQGILQKKIDLFNQSEISYESKISAVFKLFKALLVLMHDREKSKIHKLKTKKIKDLYNYFILNIESDGENKPTDPPDDFVKFYEKIAYNIDNSPINSDKFKLSETQLELLRRDITYTVQPNLNHEIEKSQARLQRIHHLITTLSAFCGDDTVDCWEKHIVPLDIQKKCTRALNIKALAEVFSGGLALGEGGVAAIGNYGLFSSVSPILAGMAVAPTLIGSIGCNYAIVAGDTQDTFNFMQGGLTKLHQNAKNEELSTTRKVLLWILSCLPSFISGACYGSLGGLSATATVSLVLSFLGISLIPVVGWIIFGVGIFTFATVFSILFIETGGAIRNATWEDFKNYFHKRFYWPSTGSKTDKTIAFFKNFFNALRILISLVVVAGLLFITGVKLFATSLISFFAKCAWGGAAANQLANGLSYINSTIWFYFNFKKGSRLLEAVSADAVFKLIPYIVEIGLRTSLYIIPALFCLTAQILSWPFSASTSKKFGSLFEKLLDLMAPHTTWNFFNKNKFLRSLSRDSHSGVDEAPENRGPIQVMGGIIKSTLALIKLVPPIIEITTRLAMALVYRLTWPVRVIFRKIHHHAYQKSPYYRKFAGKIHLKQRYREADLGSMIVPRLWNKVSGFIHQLRSPAHQQISTIAQSAQKTLAQSAEMAVDINAAGQFETFASGGSSNLPPFLKSMPSALQQTAAGGPQAICSAGLGQGACKTMLSSKQYAPLTIVANKNTLFGNRVGKPAPPPHPKISLQP